MPLSDDPEKRARQLANLVPGQGSPTAGEARHLESGWRTRNPSPLVLGPIVEELAAALAEDAPVRDADGQLPHHDQVMIRSCALDVLIVRRVAGFLETHGWEHPRSGGMRPEVARLSEANERLARKLDRLGMTPASRARLGLDLARAGDLRAQLFAAAMAEQDPERARALFEQAGIPAVGGGGK